MRNFIPPEVKVVDFEIKDVITTSEIKLPEDEIDTLDNNL
jgi:hypothetical protein